MKHPFNSYLEGLNIEIIQATSNINGCEKTFAKGEYLCREGESAFFVGFIKSGCFKQVVRDFNGNERIIGFFFRNELMTDPLSIVEQTPARYDIIAVTNSKVIINDGESVSELLDRHPEVRFEFAKRLYRQSYDRLLDLYKKSPRQRYLDIINNYPEILQEISQKELASYLQITPTYLCRIRKQLLFDKSE